MRPSSARIGRIAAPLRVMAQRFALLLLAGASITLMVLARAGYPPLESVRTAVIDVAAPVLEAATHPVAAFNRTVGDVTAFANLYEENARLREENERLRNWQSQARLLAQENAAFRGLLRAQPGVSIPHHGHNGSELTLVLKGSFWDGETQYKPGDLEEADPGVAHDIRIDEIASGLPGAER